MDGENASADLVRIFEQSVILTEVGAQIGTLANETLRRLAIVLFENHHHSRSFPGRVTQRAGLPNFD